MSEISESIWNQDKNGDWKLYFNTDQEISFFHEKNRELKKTEDEINLSDKNLALGILVMTPKGIGRLIKNNEGVSHIKFNQDNKDYEFSSNEISNCFYCYVTFILKDNLDIIRLKLKVDGKISDIIEYLTKINKINPEKHKYKLIHNKIILSNENTFEQLKLYNNTKILILETNEFERKISRFTITKKYWYNFEQDGICFIPSEDIKLVGVGLYRSHENKVINGIVKIIEGNSSMGKVLIEENVEIQPCTDNINVFSKFKFSKNIFCKKNKEYSIIFFSNIITNSYSGLKGINIIEGDKGIKFTFKRLIGNKGDSTPEYGNFPEIYYYLN